MIGTCTNSIFSSFETAVREAAAFVEKNIFFAHEYETGTGPVAREDGGMPIFRLQLETEADADWKMTNRFGDRYQVVREETRTATVVQYTQTGPIQVAILGRVGYQADTLIKD